MQNSEPRLRSRGPAAYHHRFRITPKVRVWAERVYGFLRPNYTLYGKSYHIEPFLGKEG